MLGIEAAWVVVWVDVALAAAELPRAAVARVAQRVGRPGLPELAHVGGRLLERDVGRVRLRRAGEVDRGLREVQAGLGKPDVLDRLRRRDGNEQRARVGIADVLRGEHNHSAGDEARVLAALEHRGQVVDGRVGVGAAH